MKIGTDGVLLGAWAHKRNPKHVLDVGTGTGLVALMLAQRFPEAQIQAVEIDESAFEEASLNFRNSNFAARLHPHYADFRSFQSETRFDLIVSNPPFFDKALKSPKDNRNLARHTDSLSLRSLIENAQSLLTENGVLALVIPFDREEEVVKSGRSVGLEPLRKLRVKGRADLPIKRSLIELQGNATNCQSEELIVEVERHKYTADYTTLTRAFYLNM